MTGVIGLMQLWRLAATLSFQMALIASSRPAVAPFYVKGSSEIHEQG